MLYDIKACDIHQIINQQKFKEKLNVINWGILGTGRIATLFAEDVQLTPDSRLLSVGSRSQESADKFGDKFNIRNRYPDYESLAADPDVDVIYVATPHPFHYENTKMCLEAGKAVLCEKPFTINTGETKELIALAKEKNLFLMEAMWSRFVPIYVKVREWIEDGLIGEVRMVQADFGFRVDWDPQNRLLNPDLGGGALLDVGIYPIDLASMVFNKKPKKIIGSAHLGATGVDEQSAMILTYDQGELAVLSCAVRTDTPHEAVILGTEGSIKLEPPFWHARKAKLITDGEESSIDLPIVGNGYYYEAMEVIQCLNKGLKESSIMPLSDTVRNMKIMDELRKQWGITYPVEAS